VTPGQAKLADRTPAIAESPATQKVLLKTELVLIRALASALDCLAGVIIGVAALPMNLLRADFTKARKALTKVFGSTDGASMQATFGAQLDAIIRAAGPEGWLEWTIDFRNMLVHRGRRMEFGQFFPRLPVLYGPNAEPLLRVHHVTHLPRDPGRSDVEVLLDAPWSMVLTEEAERTLAGLIDSTKTMLESTAEELLHVWEWRRTNPQAAPATFSMAERPLDAINWL
jgi:hypothetical protein